jgi:hypothetical protein
VGRDRAGRRHQARVTGGSPLRGACGFRTTDRPALSIEETVRLSRPSDRSPGEGHRRADEPRPALERAWAGVSRHQGRGGAHGERRAGFLAGDWNPVQQGRSQAGRAGPACQRLGSAPGQKARARRAGPLAGASRLRGRPCGQARPRLCPGPAPALSRPASPQRSPVSRWLASSWFASTPKPATCAMPSLNPLDSPDSRFPPPDCVSSGRG